MKSAINMLRRAWLWFAIRSVEITIHGQSECLDCVHDKLLHGRIVLARAEARRELARLRGLYNATLPPGKRVFWGMA